MSNEELKRIHHQIYDRDALKFGTFEIRKGMETPVYFDLRVLVSYPQLVRDLTELIWDQIKDLEFDCICGVPYTAIPFATVLSVTHNIPMLMCRKEQKDYGTKNMVEGHFTPGQRCLIVEDVVVSAKSIVETVQKLEGLGLKVEDAVVIIDREQGGQKRLQELGIKLHSVSTLRKTMVDLVADGKVTHETWDAVLTYLENNNGPIKSPHLPFQITNGK